MSQIEMFYIPHCDNEHCSLGTAEWDCPKCDGHNVEYGDFFYEEFDEHKGELCCDKCKRVYQVWKEKYSQYNIISIKNGEMDEPNKVPELRHITYGELSLMFTRLAIDVQENPSSYTNGNGIEEFIKGENYRRDLFKN